MTLILAFDSKIPVDPGATVTVFSDVVVPFKMKRLITSPESSDFVIDGKPTVGTRVSIGSASLNVTNRGKEPARFLASMEGSAIEERPAKDYEVEAPMIHRNSVAVGLTVLPFDSSQRGSTGEREDFNTKPIEPDERRRIISRPQVVFRPTRFFLQRPKLWRIENALIGRLSQFPTGDPIAGDLLHLADLTWDTAQVSQEICIQVTNVGPEPAHYVGALGGYYIDDWQSDKLPPLPIKVLTEVNVQLARHMKDEG